MTITLLTDNLPDRVSAAIRAGATGDWEVIHYLSQSGIVDTWVRQNGDVVVGYSNEMMKHAIEEGIEVRG